MLTIEIISINEGMSSMVHPIIVWHFRVVYDEKGNPVLDYISSIDSPIRVTVYLDNSLFLYVSIVFLHDKLP